MEKSEEKFEVNKRVKSEDDYWEIDYDEITAVIRRIRQFLPNQISSSDITLAPNGFGVLLIRFFLLGIRKRMDLTSPLPSCFNELLAETYANYIIWFSHLEDIDNEMRDLEGGVFQKCLEAYLGRTSLYCEENILGKSVDIFEVYTQYFYSRKFLVFWDANDRIHKLAKDSSK